MMCREKPTITTARAYLELATATAQGTRRTYSGVLSRVVFSRDMGNIFGQQGPPSAQLCALATLGNEKALEARLRLSFVIFSKRCGSFMRVGISQQGVHECFHNLTDCVHLINFKEILFFVFLQSYISDCQTPCLY